MLRRIFLGLALGLAASCAHAQTAPSPADVGISKGTPDVFKLKGADDVWTPFGSINSSTHIYVPATNGNIAPNDCLKWGPGLTSAGAACNSVTGGAHPANQLTIYTNHDGLVNNVTTPTEAWTVMQQGFYQSGDGGAATYDWNATSFCANATSGASAQAAGDGFLCILPQGQNQNTAGRYILRLTNGALNVMQIGFRDDGTDNGPLVDRLNGVLGRYTGLYSSPTGVPIIFPSNPVNVQSNYWFDRPLHIARDTGLICGDGSRAFGAPKVNLVFGPGVGGVQAVGQVGEPLDYGAQQISISGCGIFSTGRGGTTTVAGSTAIQNGSLAAISSIQYGALRPTPKFSVGDGIAVFPGLIYWNFSGYIVNDVLTVTSFGGGWSTTNPGIAVGQMLQIAVRGLYIKATHAEDPTFTGTGHEGTYQLNASIVSPPVIEQAIPSGLYGSAGSPVGFQNEVQTGPPAVPMGTAVTGCSTLSGSLCNGSTGTLTLSNAATTGVASIMWDLPGPNTTAPSGDQSFTVTTSSKGNVYGPITAGIAGNVMTVTGGTSNLKLGMKIIGGFGAMVHPTTTAALALGDTSIPVSSCAGIAGGYDVTAFSGGQSVFPFNTTVSSCTGTTLTIGAGITTAAVMTTKSGSNVIQATSTYYFNAWKLWKGQPVTGPGIPANTIVQGWRFTPYFAGGVDITLSNAATATTAPGVFVGLNFGGALVAAPSGTTINVMLGSSSSAIDAFGTGTGGNGTYVLHDNVFSLSPGSAVYAYDTPGTIYVSGGPRAPLPQELLWMDGVPFGTLAARMYGTPPNMTIITSDTSSYNEVPIFADHPSGSGKMWILPSGIQAIMGHNTSGNLISSFPGVGLNMACGTNNYLPIVGCGKSHDSGNTVLYNTVGRLVVGNNAGGFTEDNSEYDHNQIADIVDFSTVGGTVISDMLQGADESSNTHVLIQNCNTGTVYMGIYASGSGYSAVCAAPNNLMLSSQTLYGPGQGVAWFGPLFGGPYDVNVVPGLPQTAPSCTGVPTGSFHVQSGIVTHC